MYLSWHYYILLFETHHKTAGKLTSKTCTKHHMMLRISRIGTDIHYFYCYILAFPIHCHFEYNSAIF